ncbi:hypothetical protein HOL24_01670 [bacterium]|jgi:hypothetical protein|nr:hypothetical protein [bacterium]
MLEKYNFFGKYKLIIFVKNKLVTIDTVLPLLLEMNQKFKVRSKIVVWDDCAHNAIKKNIVIMDLINTVGCELFITKGEKRVWLRRYYIARSLLGILIESFFGAKIIHFGAFNAGFLKIISFLCWKNLYQMSSGSFNFEYKLIKLRKSNSTLMFFAGKNIISTTKDIEKTKFKYCIHNKKTYIFHEPRGQKTWIEYVYSKNGYYFDKYHNNINVNNGVLVYILGGLDAEPHAEKLFYSTMDILSKIQCDIPILIKPHAYTEMHTVRSRIAGYDRFHITYLHPSFLATKAKVFIANGFSNTFGDAHVFNVKTIEYANYSACYSKDELEYLSGKSSDPKYVDFFIDNDSNEFSRVLNSCLLNNFHAFKARGHKYTNEKLIKSLL